MWHYSYFWGFPFFPILWLVFWVFVISFCFRGRGRWHHHSHNHSDKSAEDTLRDRFAHGEINEKEYKERMRVLAEHVK